ncbi:MAG: hypothetical protein HOD92_18210 [Deltaproteobacteria bacterium]|nr:hypothetical protein [Deltaproteobacteria bacterium]
MLLTTNNQKLKRQGRPLIHGFENLTIPLIFTIVSIYVTGEKSHHDF